MHKPPAVVTTSSANFVSTNRKCIGNLVLPMHTLFKNEMTI